MTMQQGWTYSGTTADFEAARIRERESLAALASKWGVEAVGRRYPRHVTRANGYRLVRRGTCYVVIGGEWQDATSAQARQINALVFDPYASIGPIASS